MMIRNMIGISVLAFLASTVYAQTPNSGVGQPAVRSAPATTSNDPFVQKRMEDKAAKQEYKAQKKAAKKEYKQEKKQSRAELKQDLATQPAPPGAVGQPGQYGQAPVTGK